MAKPEIVPVGNTIDRVLPDDRKMTLAATLDAVAFPGAEAEQVACFHCGEPCRDCEHRRESRIFCCQGCLVVHDLLAENGLTHFYELNQHPGIRVSRPKALEKWLYLDDPQVQPRLLDFTDGSQSRVTFHVPAVHCVACVWLLENLFRLGSGIGRSQVNFARREVSITFFPAKAKLSDVAALLASLGYEPQLTLGQLDSRAGPDEKRKRQWLQVGVAGFAFGNIMLFSLPGYMGLDSLSGPTFRAVFGYISLALALPVLLYSAADYWRSALLSFRRQVVTLDVPIALGLAALYAQSAYEIMSATGEGYLDSLAGLIFFLLCGRVFQEKTHERIAFDRDYKCFFPLSVTRLEGDTQQTVAISQLEIGDRLAIRNGELIPADARLANGAGCIDYSFVTGESEPVVKAPGDYLYAGGKQVGGTIEVETLKPASQSYLTSLWNDEAFRKGSDDGLNTLTNRYSRRFTWIVLSIAVAAGLFWLAAGQGSRGLKAFTSVLIVACPCALALAAPFTLGTAQRLLARGQVFLKNAHLLEKLAGVNAIVFDKTGTLTEAQAAPPVFHAGPENTVRLGARETALVRTLCAQSTHPHSRSLAEGLGGGGAALKVEHFEEVAGAGLSGKVDGSRVLIGSASWLRQSGVEVAAQERPRGSEVCVAVDGHCQGRFVLESRVREDMDQLIHTLSQDFEITLLSGDNAREQEHFTRLFGQSDRLHFNQSPSDKLTFVRQLQQSGKRVMMVGDGLNDAGALKQSDVGVAVVERIGVFSPASDVILPGTTVIQLPEILALAKSATKVVRWGFVISALYNVIGIGVAAAGVLSPIICAVLMPTSSISVVLFACGRMHRMGRKLGLGGAAESVNP